MANQGEPLIIDFIYGIFNHKKSVAGLFYHLDYWKYFSCFGLTYDTVMWYSH